MTTDDATGLSRATALLTESRLARGSLSAASCTPPTADGSSTAFGPPGIGTWIVKSKRHVVAVGDLHATERLSVR
jgi:hypothetical protein